MSKIFGAVAKLRTTISFVARARARVCVRTLVYLCVYVCTYMYVCVYVCPSVRLSVRPSVSLSDNSFVCLEQLGFQQNDFYQI